jgi:Protein of unknown function (DUF2892)
MPRVTNLRPYSKPRDETQMTIERSIRIFAGAFVLASLALGVFVNPNFLWFTAFVGLNLFQSGFTGLCPLASILKRLGVRSAERACA